MAGYSATPLARKLGFKAPMTVYTADLAKHAAALRKAGLKLVLRKSERQQREKKK